MASEIYIVIDTSHDEYESCADPYIGVHSNLSSARAEFFNVVSDKLYFNLEELNGMIEDEDEEASFTLTNNELYFDDMNGTEISVSLKKYISDKETDSNGTFEEIENEDKTISCENFNELLTSVKRKRTERTEWTYLLNTYSEDKIDEMFRFIKEHLVTIKD